MTSKIAVGVLGVTVLGFGLYWLFKTKENNNRRSSQQQQQDIDQQIDKYQKNQTTKQAQIKSSLQIPELIQLCKSINKDHPSEQQVVELFKIIVKQSRFRGQDFINTFRIKRRKLLQAGFKQYVECIRDGLLKLKNIDGEAKGEVLQELGMSGEQYNNAEMRYQQAFQQTESQILCGQDNYLPLQQVRRILEFQKQYLENEGDQFLYKLNKQVVNWDSDQRQLVHQILNTFVIDQVYEKFGYEQELTERSIIMCKHEVIDEVMEIRDVLTGLFIKLSEPNEQQQQQDEIRLDTKLIKDLSAEPQFEQVMRAMHKD